MQEYNDVVETISFDTFIDAYEKKLSDTELWDFLVDNGYILPTRDGGY